MLRRLFGRIKNFFKSMRRPDPSTTASTTMGAAMGRGFIYTLGTIGALSAGAVPLAIVVLGVGVLDIWYHLWAGYHLAVYSIAIQPLRGISQGG